MPTRRKLSTGLLLQLLRVGVSLGAIPRQIIQTSRCKETLPASIQRATQRWQSRSQAEGFSYRFFTDADARRYLCKHFPASIVRAFDRLRPGAFKADLFRYAILHREGGIYVDVDLTPLASVAAMLPPPASLVGVAEAPGSLGVYQAFLAAEARLPCLQRAIDMIVRNVEGEVYPPTNLSLGIKTDLAITGPFVLAQAINATRTLVEWHRPGYHDLGAGQSAFLHALHPSSARGEHVIMHGGTISTRILSNVRRSHRGPSSYFQQTKAKAVYGPLGATNSSCAAVAPACNPLILEKLRRQRARDEAELAKWWGDATPGLEDPGKEWWERHHPAMARGAGRAASHARWKQSANPMRAWSRILPWVIALLASHAACCVMGLVLGRRGLASGDPPAEISMRAVRMWPWG